MQSCTPNRDEQPAREECGLTSLQAEESRRVHGANAFTGEKPVSLLRRLWEAASEPMILMLILAGVIALVVNIIRQATGGEADMLECVGIFVAISLSVVITVVMEGRSAKAFEALSRINEDALVKVLRDGELTMIPQKDVVVGDVVCVETGDKLPADGRILGGTALQADESALTGESHPVDKQAGGASEGVPLAEQDGRLFRGCFITGGHGRMVVTQVGDGTEFGKIARELSQTTAGSTPLQEKLARLGKLITCLGAAAAAVVFLVQLGIFLTNGTAGLDTISEAFITSIVLIVAAVPEGLPTIVAVSLAINIIKMSKQNALVKKMIACETVGCIHVICSDKTGTLTENRMSVTALSCGTAGTLWDRGGPLSAVLADNMAVNSTADVRFEDAGPVFIGNPTECALLSAAHEAGVDYRARREETAVSEAYPFSSETKNMTTIVAVEEGFRAYTKGSPERILSFCRLTQEETAAIDARMLVYQEKACRVIAFAHRDFDAMPAAGDRTAVEAAMTFDGFAAIADPLRADVCAAADTCRRAGIELKMLTGDNLVTAKAIAREMGLLEDGHSAVEASALEGLTDEQLREALPQIRVIARSTPTVKMRVVTVLKSLGYVVAVTGDGINDAPALKSADVGIAMGISGTEVSKEASDIVLLDDSFSTIVKAVKWGRGIYENFQRFIQFQLTVNLSSVVVVLASIVAGFHSPFTALQLLWINLIMDGPPALTLGLEPIREDLLGRRPTPRSAAIVTGGMLRRIGINGLFIAALFLVQTFTNFLGGTPEQASTILFTLFVVCQLFNAFNSRELTDDSVFRHVADNKLMLLVFAVTFSLQVFITQFGGAFFGTVPLPVAMWGKIVLTALSVIAVSELVKLVRRLLHRAGKPACK